METDVQVTAHVNLSDSIMDQVAHMAGNPNFWLFVLSMVATMALMQGVKAVIKQVMADRSGKARRRMTFILAFITGYFVGFYFIEGAHVEKWSIVVGLFNPFFYWMLLQYARVKNKVIWISVLKMRPPVQAEDGSWSVHDTQTFFVKQK